MDIAYFFIILSLSVAIPLLLHRLLKKKIKKATLLRITEVVIGIIIVLIGTIIPFLWFSPVVDYPTVTKNINKEYYFEQTEYGMAWSEPGKNTTFYKKRKYWFDKRIGHINFPWEINDINAVIKNGTKQSFKRLILKTNNGIVLDTIINFQEGFNFKYLSLK